MLPNDTDFFTILHNDTITFWQTAELAFLFRIRNDVKTTLLEILYGRLFNVQSPALMCILLQAIVWYYKTYAYLLIDMYIKNSYV